MKLRKGWIFRTVYLERKSLFACYVFYIIFIVLGLLVQLSIKTGNLSHMSEEDANFIKPMMYHLFVLFSPIVISITMNPSETIFADFKTGWSKYEKTLPLSATERSAYKIGTITVFYLISLILSIINMVIFTLVQGCTYKVGTEKNDLVFMEIKGFHFDTRTFKIILIILMLGVFASVYNCVTASFLRNRVLIQTVGFVTVLLVYFGSYYAIYQYIKKTFTEFGIISSVKEDFPDTEAISHAFEKISLDFSNLVDVLGMLAPFITILLFIIGFFLMKRIFEKKEG